MLFNNILQPPPTHKHAAQEKKGSRININVIYLGFAAA